MSTETLPTVICGTEDHPLVIGDLQIPCYVLEDETRVLAQRGMVDALGMSRGSSGGTGGDRLAKFASGKALNPYISAELLAVTQNPIKFITPHGNTAYGYEASVLADLCETVLKARDARALQKQQEHIARQCEVLVRGFARVGIIALVDEATGFQRIRSRRALEEILEAYIAAEKAKWAKRFPDEFYQLIFEMKGWAYDPSNVARPAVIGHYTNDFVYDRLAPGLREELSSKNPSDETGNRKARHHQWLTTDIGHPRLAEHLSGVIALMRVFKHDWEAFKDALDKAFPKFGETMSLPFIETE